MTDFAAFTLQAIQQPAKNGYQWFLMIDCAVNLKIDIASDLRIELQALDLLSLEPVDWRECVSPVLLPLPVDGLSDKQSRAWLQFMQRWQYTNALTVLESSLYFEALAHALNQRTDALLTDDMSVVLRFFDTRTIATLRKILSPEQLRVFTSIAQRWIYIDRYGEAQTLQQSKSAVDDDFVAPLEFSAQQEAQLIEAGEIDAMVNLLVNQQINGLIDLTPPVQYDLTAQLLSNTKDYQINQLSDQAAFCRVGLELGSDFHQKSPWSTELVDVTAQRSTFTQLLEKLAS
jgi:hypothetical protein